MISNLKSYFDNCRLTTIYGTVASGKTATVLQIIKLLNNEKTNHLIITDEVERISYYLRNIEYSYKYLFENNVIERLSSIYNSNFKAKSRMSYKPINNVKIIPTEKIIFNTIEQLNNFMDQYNNIYIDSTNNMPIINFSEHLNKIREILHKHLNNKIFLTINMRKNILNVNSLNNIDRNFQEKCDVLINSRTEDKKLWINFTKHRFKNLNNIDFNIRDIYSLV